MNRIVKYAVSLAIISALLLNCFLVNAQGQNGISMGSISIDQGENTQQTHNGSPVSEAPTKEKLKYEPVSLSEETRDFFATVDATVNITLISSQTDFVAGDYLKYHYSYDAETLKYYYDVINTLKTIAELNTNVKLNFIDPFSISSKEFMNDYKKYKLKYGDIMLSCVVNFDSSFNTRNTVLRTKRLFKFDKENDNQIVGVNVEKNLVSKLNSIRELRDINVAYIDDISLKDTFSSAKSYMSGSRYNIDSVTLQTEQLNGYDMIIICSPTRDITLEELVLIDNFLSLGDDRSFLYIAPKNYVKLTLLNSLVGKWGIAMDSQRVLYTDHKKGYFSKTSQLYAKAHKSNWLNPSEINGNLIMDNCTPISLLHDDSDVKVTTLLSTESDKVLTTVRKDTKEYKKIASGIGVTDTSESEYPLATLSEKEFGHEGKSSVIVYASVDFITTYFALENDKTDRYPEVENGNLHLFETVLNNLNLVNRDKPSGLHDYAVNLSEMGIDTTSGYETDYIITFGVIVVIIPVVILITVILIFSRRKRNAKSKQFE